MINEPASTSDDRPALRPLAPFDLGAQHGIRDQLRLLVMEVFAIEHEPRDAQELVMQRDAIFLLRPDSSLTASFEGRLLIDSEEAYRRLDEGFARLDHLLYFREVGDKHMIHAVRGRIVPRPRPLWVHIALLVATIFTLLITGTGIALGELSRQNPALVEALSGRILLELWRGIPYALALILILGAHELGHYFAARRHRIAVTLPYFIPDIVSTLLLPVFGLGTFGAFIQQQEPFRNRKVMFDIGAAGPLFGLVFAIPIVFIGLATSPVLSQPPIAVLEGNSLLYALAKTIVFGRFLPADGVDVFMNQLAQAGWAGLLVTALNLIPMGQLDGGHIMFSLIGNHARRLFFPLLGVLFVLALFESAWVFWFILLFFFGRFYAPPLDMITRLDARRRALAFLALFLFVVTFVPSPLTIVENPGQPLPQDSAFWMSMSVAVMFAFTRLRRR